MIKDVFPTDHRSYLINEYQARFARRPAYSKRAFARDIQVSPASFTEFLKGKTSFSANRIRQISKLLRLENEQIEHWLDLIAIQFSKTEFSKKKAQTRIQARLQSLIAQKAIEKYQVASRWECWAYLELLEIDKKAQDDKYAAKWLKLSIKQFSEIKMMLLDLGIISFSTDKGLQRSQNADVFGGEMQSLAVRNYHRGLLRKATLALDEQDFEKRFFSSVILSLPKNKIKSLFTEIENRVYELLIESSSAPEKDAVYCFSFQLYDLYEENKDELSK